jgi:tetratricopeptide (TPR) repeat protein
MGANWVEVFFPYICLSIGEGWALTDSTSFAELVNHLHKCEYFVSHDKIAASLIAFKEIIEQMPAVSISEAERKELFAGMDSLLNNLSAHKIFKEIFGGVSPGDGDVEAKLELIRSMIVSREQEIIQKARIEEKVAEVQRLEIVKTEANQQIKAIIKLIDAGSLPQAMEMIKDNEEIRDAIILYYNDLGMQHRKTKEFVEAVKNYSQAMSISPQDENLYYNIARAYFEEGKPEKAEEFLGKALLINPEFKEGKVFYEYLLKLDPAGSVQSGNGKKQSDGFFKKLFSSKKLHGSN